MTLWAPRWQPLSAVFLEATHSYLSPAIARHLMKMRGSLDVTYLGDRLWPAIQHGAGVTVAPLGDAPLARGTLVLALVGDIPDLLRIERDDGAAVTLMADADSALNVQIARHALLGVAARPPRIVTPTAALWRRCRLDLREAACFSSDEARDAADTVLAKYETQAPFYDDSAVSTIQPELRASITRHAPVGSSIVVAGCGTGAECRDLASSGYRVLGLDFSEEMIRRAREASAGDGAPEYRLADLRHATLPAASCAIVLFTPDVYSFLPTHTDRARGWGSSHTRWVAQDGTLKRSFIRLFSERQLAREFAAVGLHQVERAAGWRVLKRRELLPHPR